MNIESEILRHKTASILLIEERLKKDILITAPHHSLGGIKELPCPEHTDGDENTGFITRQIAESLNVCSIIACNYRVDPNKCLGTDYSMQIAKWSPKYLIEIHGHGAKGGNKPDNSTIEISSGKKDRNEISIRFAASLKKQLNQHETLKHYKVCGDLDYIYFKATKTATIIDDRWTPFQIELPPSLRLDKNNELPDFNDIFCTCLIATINEICV